MLYIALLFLGTIGCIFLMASNLGFVGPLEKKKPVIHKVAVSRDTQGSYIIGVSEQVWPIYSQQLARGMKDYGIDGVEFVQMPHVVQVIIVPEGHK